MTENNQINQHRIPNWVTYIVVIIFIAIVTVVGMNLFAPTIGNVYPSPLDGISLDWSCVEKNNCRGCVELNWDTGWCYECILKCSN